MRLLIVTAVEKEREAIGSHDGVDVIVSGIGRTNAAAATTQHVLCDGPWDAVLSAGVAGSLPGEDPLALGESILASSSIYVEEGLETPGGFLDMEAFGLSLGDFTGNTVPADGELLAVLSGITRVGRIATVATCSGTDERARDVAGRTGALAEAMEGAAVLHAALRAGIPAIELRVISNTTGHRDAQAWDLPGAFTALGKIVDRAISTLREEIRDPD